MPITGSQDRRWPWRRESRLLEGYYRRPQEDLNRGAWVPAVDMYSNGHDLVLKAELPDMKEDEIELTIENNTLTLSGEKKLDTEVTPNTKLVC